MILGIDATNIRSGGGVTHLVELLNNSEPRNDGFKKVIIWSNLKTLKQIKDQDWLKKINPVYLEKNMLNRVFWQLFYLSKECKSNNCNILLIPGGSFFGSFKPIVSISQNLLPFDRREMNRYFPSLFFFKLLLLRFVQANTFKKSNGVIFLSSFARNQIQKFPNIINIDYEVIPHGINNLFFKDKKPQNSIEDYSTSKPYRILYVSKIDLYKHQWNVVEALYKIRKEKKWPIILDLVGGAFPPALKKLTQVINKCDSERKWVNYMGELDYDILKDIYINTDLIVFASSCENMPNILIESMATGIPIASSNRGPMPEVLKDAGLYFDPESIDSISTAIENLIISPELRTINSRKSQTLAINYNWGKCSKSTFNFIKKIKLKFNN
jgi:glycosyltransferase involved in cell wall biosynthesis